MNRILVCHSYFRARSLICRTFRSTLRNFQNTDCMLFNTSVANTSPALITTARYTSSIAGTSVISNGCNSESKSVPTRDDGVPPTLTPSHSTNTSQNSADPKVVPKSKAFRKFQVILESNKIIKVFDDYHMNKQKALLVKRIQNLIEENLENWSFNNIATFLQQCGKVRIDISGHFPALLRQLKSRTDIPDDPTLFSKIFFSLQHYRSTHINNATGKTEVNGNVHSMLHHLASLFKSQHRFPPWALGNCMYGLQGMSNEYAPVREMLLIIHEKLEACKDPFPSEVIGNSLFGLRRMDSTSPIVRAIIATVTSKLTASNESLSSKEASKSLFGISNMSCNHPEILNLISALDAKLKSSEDNMQSSSIGNSVYALKAFHWHRKEVRSLISTLAGRINSSSTSLTAIDASKALYGLQNLNIDTPEVLQLLEALQLKLASCTEAFTAECIGSLYGLKGMSSTSPQVQSLLHVLVQKINTCSTELGQQGLSNSLYGLQGMCSEHEIVRVVLSSLTHHISKSTAILCAQGIGNSLYGLQGMNSDHKEVRQLLGILLKKVSSCSQELQAQEISNALYGLQSMNSDSQEVLDMLTALLPKVISCQEKFSPQEIGSAFYGLRGMSSEHKVVRDIVEVLTAKLQSCDEMTNGQEISNSLYGMNRMDSVYPVVQQMLETLTVKINSSPAFKSEQVTSAMYGLRSMSSSELEVRIIVDALRKKLECVDNPLTAHNMSNLIYALNGMSSDHSEVLTMLSVLSNKISMSKEPLSAQGVGNSLYGLQGLSSNHHECLSLLSALYDKVAACNEDLSGQEFCNAFYGFQNMTNQDKAVESMLMLLRDKFNSYKVRLSCQMIGQSLYGLQGVSFDEGWQPAINLFLNSARQFLESHLSSSSTPDASVTPASAYYLSKVILLLTGCNLRFRKSLEMSGQKESLQQLRSLALRVNPPVIKSSSVYLENLARGWTADHFSNEKFITVSSNQSLFGFEADIVIRDSRRPDYIINIELDGGVHSRVKKQLFCKLRDENLEANHGVKVHRFEVVTRSTGLHLEEQRQSFHEKVLANINLLD